MVFSVLCCIVAWRNAVHRLGLVSDYGDPMGYMSVYRLTPQYVLLAFMGGLAQDGLGSFFDSQVAVVDFKYAPSFGGCAVGIGKFLSVFCVIIFSGWIKKETNSSHLDKYYAMLAIVSSVNVVYYCLVAWWYGDESFKDEGDEAREEDEDGLDIVGDVQELVLENVQLVVEGTEKEEE